MVSRYYMSGKRFRSLLILNLSLLFCFWGDAIGQETTYNVFYRVFFKDKGSYSVNDFSPSDLFSDKAIERREKAHIYSLHFSDLPLFPQYIDEISSKGFTLHCTSKWLNTAVFKTGSPRDIQDLLQLPFVTDIKIVKNTSGRKKLNDKFNENMTTDIPSPYYLPLEMTGGLAVQRSGFTGKGVLVAVLDGGFTNADKITSLEGLGSRKGIKATFDFVMNTPDVYNFHNHGTAVLSILAGELPGEIAGSAPGADYILLRTEDTQSEFPVEEDFWIAGAEFADSCGADIISSSLGYFIFDDPEMNYKYSDMDGNTAFVTKGADIAASKGILVVASAGNERDNDWLHIIAPSDGDSVLSIGAVNPDRNISSFSSAGPSFDKRVKPDAVAQGVSVPIQTLTQTVSRGNGTSFSCPVISGVSACLMQAVPLASSFDILASIHYVSDRYNHPDSLYGYGIPDFIELISVLQNKLIIKPGSGSVLSPNPFYDHLTVTFKEPPESFILEILSSAGTLMYKTNIDYNISRSVIIDELGYLGQGLYIVRITTPAGKIIHKAIKF